MLRSGSRLSKLGSFKAPLSLSRHAQLQGKALGLRDRRWASTVTALENYPSAGEKLHGFIVQEKKHIPELHLSAIHLKHEKTDADYLHVARDDKNNVFGISFKTNPPDATGVPHILEHTTLCGSEKYPVRDPFFKMLPRSLSNFMNAFTSADHTTYPFATTNKKDFQNLLSVYLDATLHPLLKEEDFRQEGWRLGPENARPEQSPEGASGEQPKDDIVFKGVVYNEMKGQMSDANYLYYIRFREQIIPALANSGGDPKYIPDLTHKQLVDYSKSNYHPSNARIFTYGDMPLDDHLAQVGEVLNGFEKKSKPLDVKLPVDLSSGPSNIAVTGPIDTFASEDKQTKTSVSWLAGDSSDNVELFSMGILSSLLLDGYGSPLYRALVESGIGSSFTPNTGLDTSGKVPIFSVGVNGISEANIADVQRSIQNVYEEHLANGFNDEKVQGMLHQLELALRHKTANFGMGIMDKVISAWFNGSDPMKDLAWNEVINGFKKRYEQGGYLESLMKKYFMNDKYMVFTMTGDSSYNNSLVEYENSRKETMMNELSQKYGSMELAKDQLKKEELELLNVQEAAQQADLSCLPTLTVSDIPRQKEKKPLSESKIDNVDVVWRQAPTNGLSYIQVLNALNGLPDHLRLLVPLFNDCIMRLGTSNRRMEQWEDLIKLKTGGINSSTFSASSPLALDKFSEGIQFSGFALDKNIPDMFEILTTLVNETTFTGPDAPKMIEELLKSSCNGALDSVAATGHRFAVNMASSSLSRKFWAEEQISGLSQIQKMAQLLQDAQQSPDKLQELIGHLQTIQSFALGRSSNLKVRVVCEPEMRGENEAMLQRWLNGLHSNTSPTSSQGTTFLKPSSDKVLYDLPFQVSYSGLAMETTPYVSSSSAPLSVLAQLLTHNYLHPEIREKGGAYGAGASNGPVRGLFTFSSYRDPNPMNTLKVFNNSGVYARDRTWTQRELDEAKLSIFQLLDAPMSIEDEGHRYFMSGVTHEMDQKWREQVLDVTTKDVSEVAQKFIVEASQRSFCLLGKKKEDWPDLEGWDVKKISMSPSQDSVAGAA
ncbi:mitochondrial presequence protease [Arthroderma uncinatum]|uniref:mitochondrial presequence protease n=1 Tax=Arthroderma uncinatum TaxID=74035 RepID=UPI00144AD3A1|nr:mitochondrial presequence protease [Arthroderma uncinatum]KAF3481614.1 mitochondrial presequence protease [Arthroderma uncinatum]